MRQRKYILVEDEINNKYILRIGYPIYHRDLMNESDRKNHISCIGGGKWNLNYKDKTISLYGSSDDFGKPNQEKLQKAIKNFNEHDWWQLEWICERIYEEEFPEETWENMKDKYKIIIES